MHVSSMVSADMFPASAFVIGVSRMKDFQTFNMQIPKYAYILTFYGPLLTMDKMETYLSTLHRSKNLQQYQVTTYNVDNIDLTVCVMLHEWTFQRHHSSHAAFYHVTIMSCQQGKRAAIDHHDNSRSSSKKKPSANNAS